MRNLCDVRNHRNHRNYRNDFGYESYDGYGHVLGRNFPITRSFFMHLQAIVTKVTPLLLGSIMSTFMELYVSQLC